MASLASPATPLVTAPGRAEPMVPLAGDSGAALLIIDMVSLMDFQTAGDIAKASLAAARCVRRLRRHCHERGWPVIFANDNFSHWHADFRDLVAMARHRGGVAAAIVDLLPPMPQDYFVLKPKHSAFLASPLPVLLAKLQVKKLLITGIALESCVLATALDAHAREFQVAIVRDAVAGLAELREATLTLLPRSEAATIIDSVGAHDWVTGRGP